MPRAGFEPTIPVFARLKAVHALDRAATGTGNPVGAHITKHVQNSPSYSFLLLEVMTQEVGQSSSVAAALISTWCRISLKLDS